MNLKNIEYHHEYRNMKALYTVNGLVFNVKIVDTKSAYGRTLLLIEPNSGEGRKWVDLTSVTVQEK